MSEFSTWPAPDPSGWRRHPRPSVNAGRSPLPRSRGLVWDPTIGKYRPVDG